MKQKIISTLAIAIIGFGLFTSCKKDKEPANVMAGDFYGSFEGEFEDVDSLVSTGYLVKVTALNDNKVKVIGANFEQFEVLVTSNGLNVQPVSQSDPYLESFLYIGEDRRLKFVFNKGGNTASFIGVK